MKMSCNTLHGLTYLLSSPRLSTETLDVEERKLTVFDTRERCNDTSPQSTPGMFRVLGFVTRFMDIRIGIIASLMGFYLTTIATLSRLWKSSWDTLSVPGHKSGTSTSLSSAGSLVKLGATPRVKLLLITIQPLYSQSIFITLPSFPLFNLCSLGFSFSGSEN